MMAATHRDLRRGIEDGTFREDLYYRLNVINIVIPPLRERQQEILPLAEVLLRRHLPPGETAPVLTKELQAAMLEYNWPGNVREVENVMRRYLVYQDADMLIQELVRLNSAPAALSDRLPERNHANGNLLTMDHLEQSSRTGGNQAVARGSGSHTMEPAAGRGTAEYRVQGLPLQAAKIWHCRDEGEARGSRRLRGGCGRRLHSAIHSPGGKEPVLFENLREDFRTYDRQWSRQGLWVMVVYRFGRWRYTVRRRWLRLPFSFIYKLLKPFSEILTGIELPCEATLGKRFRIDHFGGIVISGDAVFGDDCVIRNGVTVGLRHTGVRGAPILGNRVDVGAGAKILGAIRIGDDVAIGANAVVLKDVPSNSIAVGIPARILPRKVQEVAVEEIPDNGIVEVHV